MADNNFRVETINLREVQDYIRTIPEKSFPKAKEKFQKAAIEAANTVKLMKKLKVRSGALRRSIQQDVSGNDFNSLRASVYSAQGSGAKQVLYAPVQEFGHPGIKPIDKYKGVPGGPYMNIPTKANQTPAGVMRMSAWQLFRAGAYIHKAGKSWGVFLNGQMMMFLTKGPIRLKPRLGMRDAAEAEVPTLLSNLADVIGAE